MHYESFGLIGRQDFSTHLSAGQWQGEYLTPAISLFMTSAVVVEIGLGSRILLREA
jgi:hypothetical protein